MALIKCPECKKKISDQCNTCPHCGFPIGVTIAQSSDSVNITDTDNNTAESVNNNDVINVPQNPSKKPVNKKVLISIIVGSLVVLIVGGIIAYNASLPLINAKKEFKDTVSTVTEKNKELDQEIANAEELIKQTPYSLNENFIFALEHSITEAKESKVTDFDTPDSVDEINARIEELKNVDYTEEIENLKKDQEALTIDSKRFELVNNPSAEYIIECLKKVPEIVDTLAVTENNDPNGQLNKPGGYTSAIYFADSRVDPEELYGETLIDRGTDAGGCVEVYASVEDANKRKDYLSLYNGGIFASGSNIVVGTVLIRTSNKLTASQQQDLADKIVAALTYLTDYDGDIIHQLQPEKPTITETTTTTTITSSTPTDAPQTSTTTVTTKKPESTTTKHNNGNYDSKSEAVKKAKELYNSDDNPSPGWVWEWLVYVDGFSEEDALYAIENSGLNWKKTAVDYVNQYDEYSDMSPLDIENELIDRGYSDEEIIFAIDNCNVNWKEVAVRYAGYVQDFYTRQEVIDRLQESWHFTKEEAEYGVNNADIDWYAIAEEYAQLLVEQNPGGFTYCRDCCTPFDHEYNRCPSCHSNYLEISCSCAFTKDELISKIVSKGFSKEEAEYAVTMWDELKDFFAGGSNHRKAFAYFSFERYLSNSEVELSRKDMTVKMKEWGFSDSEIEYAQSLFEDYHFSY